MRGFLMLPLLAIFSLFLSVRHVFYAAPEATATTTLSAAADGYTRNGTYAATNYGTASTFVVKTTTTAGVARASYLKFSLGSVSGTVTSAVLRIYGRCTETGIVAKLGAYGISDDSWTETGITWNNAPAASATAITTLDVDDVNKYRDIDITAYVQEQLAGDKTVSLLLLKSPTNANRYLEFYSKEKSSNRPQLVITTTTTPPANQAPVLSAIGNKDATVGEALSFTAAATDADAGQTLSYSLVNAPSGAAIDAATGVFSWTPAQAGDYTFSVQVADNGSPIATDEESITIHVIENQPPVLDAIGNRNLVVGQALTFTATASDPNNGQSHTYSLINAPNGATINPTTGAFSWTPGISDNYTFTVKVADNGNPPLTDEEQITVTVNEAPEANNPPVLTSIGNKSITLGQTLNFTASATDPDAGQTISFSLIDEPEGATINNSTGVFSWTPTTSGSYTFTVLVSDNITPALTDEEQITVTVNEVNVEPVLAPIGNKNATVGQLLSFTASASDGNSGQTLTYSLVNAPSGAVINAATGEFSWTPASPGTFTFSVKVSDNGSPAATDDEPITVTVQQPATGTTTLGPVADAYTRNGTYASNNFGTASTFVIKTTTTTGVARASYLKFSLASLSGTVGSAKLRIYGRCTETGITTALAAYGISDDGWTETGITWNNAPAGGTTALSSISVPDQSAYYELDVTSFVQSQLSGDKVVSLLLKSPTNANRYLEFNSKEKSSNRPQLVITTTTGETQANQAPVLNAIGNKTGFVGQLLSFTASASDVNSVQTLTYSLVNAPSGATIDASTGAFSWTPATTGNVSFTIRVSDNGTPALSDEEQITVAIASAPVTKTFSNTQSKTISNPGTVNIPITVSGLPSNIDTVTYGLQSVGVKITHPSDKELTLKLRSPDNKVIYLFRKSPGVNINTTFDGVASKFIDNNEISLSYAGSFTSGYRPRQELSLLNNGQDPNGNWTLEVTDDNAASTAGQVTEFSLVFGPNPAKPLLSSSTLPIIRINTENGADIVDDPKILADMFIINNGAGNINYANQTTYQYKGKIGIEIRGNSSATRPNTPKRQYGFETRLDDGVTDTDVSFFGMPKQADWILSAVMSDKSLMRNVLTYRLANQMGWWASHTQFCEVIINDEYRGVFIFEEKIKRDKNRVDVEKMAATDVTAPNVTGGYIFKLDDIDADAVTWQTKIEPKFRAYQFVYPKPEDVVPQQKAYLQSYVDSFEAAINGSDISDPAKGFRHFADDKSFIDYFIIAEVAKDIDAYHISSYFYKKRGGKIVAQPVWDKDRAWRNDSRCNFWNPEGYAYIEVECQSSNMPWWWKKLIQETKFKQDIVCRYNALRQTTLSLQNIYRIIDSAAAVLNAGGQQRNFIRWDIINKNVQSNISPYPTSYAVEIETLKKWIADRLAWLDSDLGVCANSVTATQKTTTPAVLEESGNSIVNIFPSPFKDQVTVAVTVAKEQHVSIRLTDLTGRAVYQKALTLQKGARNIPLDLEKLGLAKGLYILQVNGATFTTSKKVLKE